jgi:hypothetical protein
MQMQQAIELCSAWVRGQSDFLCYQQEKRRISRISEERNATLTYMSRLLSQKKANMTGV